MSWALRVYSCMFYCTKWGAQSLCNGSYYHTWWYSKYGHALKTDVHTGSTAVVVTVLVMLYSPTLVGMIRVTVVGTYDDHRWCYFLVRHPLRQKLWFPAVSLYSGTYWLTQNSCQSCRTCNNTKCIIQADARKTTNTIDEPSYVVDSLVVAGYNDYSTYWASAAK